MTKVLIIGGNGFIGKNIVKYMQSLGYIIGVYDLAPSVFNEITSYVGDIINDEHFGSILGEYDIIIYLISAIMPKMSMDEPLSSYTTDIPLLIKTLEQCRDVGIKRLIYSSSGGTVYGDSVVANNEEVLTKPINHYAICKLTCEKILLLYNQLFGMENVILRISNPYGPYQRIASGVGAVTTFTCKILQGEKISIWGDGNNVRDYIDVKYVAEAFECASRWKFSDQYVPVFNVGSGKGLSLNQLLRLIEDELHQKAEVEYLPKRDFDVRSNYLDTSKTYNVLGIDTGRNAEDNIRQFVRYCKKQLEK